MNSQNKNGNISAIADTFAQIVAIRAIVLGFALYSAGPLSAEESLPNVKLPAVEENRGNPVSCGTLALQQVARAMKAKDFDVSRLLIGPVPPNGFSMTKLAEIADNAGLSMVAVERQPGDPLIVPSVAHYRQGHYVAIVAQKGDSYGIVDPMQHHPVWLTAAEISIRSSGFFLVPADKAPLHWQKVPQFKTDFIVGTGWWNPTNSDGCSSGGGGGAGGGGGDTGNGNSGSPPIRTPGAIGGGPAALGGGPGAMNGGQTGSNILPGGAAGGGPGCTGCGGSGGSGDGSSTGGDGGQCCNSGGGPGGGGMGTFGGDGMDGSEGSDGMYIDEGAISRNSSGIAMSDCGNDGIACRGITSSGMTTWQVSEPYISLWLYDEPLGYQPGLGNRISFKLAYKQNPDPPTTSSFFSFGGNWNCSWLSYVLDNPASQSAMLQMPKGGTITVSFSSTGTNVTSSTEYYTQATSTRTSTSGGALTGYSRNYPDGSVDHFNYIATNQIDGLTALFLTSHVDPAGHATQFNYTTDGGGVLRLVSVVDADGQTNALSYTNTSYPAQVTGVTDPFGRHATLIYDNNGMLTNITDVVGIKSSFVYNSDTSVSNLITPYGVTTFTYTTNNTIDDVISRSITVVDAGGGTNLYMYRYLSQYLDTNHTTLLLPPSYSSDQVPTNLPTSTINNGGGLTPLYQNNSFHWGPLQYSHLSTTNMSAFTVSDYLKARRCNWLFDVNGFPGHTISLKIAPSVDGTAEGQKTWYDYDGKLYSYQEGTNFHPSLVAKVLPDKTTRFTWYVHDAMGNATNVVDTYSAGWGANVLYRTNQYIYAGNGIDLARVLGPNGERLAAFNYNTNHQMLTFTNAVGDVTTYTYDTQGRLTSTHTPAGRTSTNIYFSSGQYTNWVQTNIDLEIGRTNTFTYTNDLVYIHTNELGLVTTNLYDNLQRIISISDPRGSISLYYSNLDLVKVVDRLGHSNMFDYDALRHKVAHTNALGNYTLFNYCACGALDSIQDALTNITYFYYNNAGWLTNAVYPDGSSITNKFDLLGELTNSVDMAGVSVTNWFNNQGLKYAVSNYFGRAAIIRFDIEDFVTNSVDANGVSLTNCFDNVGHLISRTYPDGGMESFVYTNLELIRYTNQLTNVTFYGYDAAMRKTAETNANNETNSFTYDPAGNLLTLTDGKGQSTSWNYDLFGRMSNKVDAASHVILVYHYDTGNRLTNRYSLSKGNTYYSYDAVGNLTYVSYDTNHSVSMAYDADNRLTNLVDGIGTTSYSYDAVGQLLSEGGLWPDDTVSYTYNNRLRTSLVVQQPGADFWSQTYGYDPAQRLTNTTSPAGVFGYSYDTTCNMFVRNLTLPNGALITNAFDGNARLLASALINSGNTILNSHSYTYNVGNQRTNQTFTAGNYDNYTYDNIGQLTSALGKESGGTTNRLLEQFGYAYDAAHNLNSRTNNALIQTFAVNSLNELSNVTRVGTLTVEGTTGAPATNVAVNGSSAILYSDNTFAEAGFSVTNGSNSFTAIAADALGRHSTNAITAYLPATNNYSYDLNGNLLSDGTRNFGYDDENQLTSITVSNAWQSQFIYDGKMRRRITREFTWSSASTNWVQTNEIHYIYDRNVVVQERDINNLPITTYTRGNDLSGSLQGAGGIGGMLAMSQPSAVNPQHYYYHADGSGNITAMLNSQQIIVAKYLYDPFGNILSMAGPLAIVNTYRFSSKETHQNSGLVYYLFRYYDSSLQRWLNSDPASDFNLIQAAATDFDIGGQAAINTYQFVMNNAVSVYDAFGLMPPWITPDPWWQQYLPPWLQQYAKSYDWMRKHHITDISPSPSHPSVTCEFNGPFNNGIHNHIKFTGDPKHGGGNFEWRITIGKW